MAEEDPDNAQVAASPQKLGRNTVSEQIRNPCSRALDSTRATYPAGLSNMASHSLSLKS